MRKLIAAINMTLDGYCDHTAMIADDETHRHYSNLLESAGTILFGRITYELMEYWETVVAHPTENAALNRFAVTIDQLSKIVYSRTRQTVSWNNTALKRELTREDILAMKQQAGKSILAGSPGIIAALTEMDLVDEYQLALHPIILAKGLRLFANIKHRLSLELRNSQTMGNGVIILSYGRGKN